MLILLMLAAALALVQSVPATSVAQTRPVAAREAVQRDADSARVRQAAKRAQEAFELVRRRNLPREFGLSGHSCDVIIGRWCIWNDDSDEREPPPESPRIRDAREKLLGVFDSLGALRPTDEWIAAQHVRYLLEAKRYLAAARIADRCAARDRGSYFCAALAGLAYHDSGVVAAADSAFSGALAAMPDTVRCRWTDIEMLLDDDVQSRYAKLDCAGRAAIADAFWRLGAPLYLVGATDWRSEFLARVARVELERGTKTPMGSSTDPGLRQMAIRYGIGTWYSVEEPPPGSMREAVVAGHNIRGSGFNFVPAARALAAPAALRAEDWELTLRTSRTRYAPSYATHFRTLPRYQLALFRRGDSALVVGAYDVHDDTLLARRSLEAGLFAAPVDGDGVTAPTGAALAEAASQGVLTTKVAWKPMVVSLELLARESKSAARVRHGVQPAPARGRVTVSDLLLFTPRDTGLHHLADVLPLALATDRVPANRPLGLFWETYGVRPTGELLAVSLTVERRRESWLRRAGRRLGLVSHTSPLRVQWQEVPDRAEQVAARAVTVDLSRLEAGRYEVQLTITPRGEPPVIATREVVIER